MTPASIRNNNPGAMKLGASAKRFGGVHGEYLKSADGTHQVVRFPTPEHGAAAMFYLLHRYYTNRSLEDAIVKWCGKIRANSYLTLIEQRCEIKRADQLTTSYISDPKTAVPFAKAMARHEAGQEYPMSDLDWLEAHQMAFGEAKAPAPSPTNDVPTMRLGDRFRNIFTNFRIGLGVLSTGGIGALFSEAMIPAPPAGIKQTFVNLGQWQEAVPVHQWQMLGIGAVVFAAVAGGAAVIQRLR